jgi:nitroreductase
MKAGTSIIEIIKRRKSVRTFEREPVETAVLKEINTYICTGENLTGPFGGRIRLYLTPVIKNISDKGIKLGTYGIIKNPQAYAVGVIENNINAFIEYGYVFENLILHLTGLNLGTCWLGGTFTRSSFEREIPLEENEVIPAVTPIGYAGKKQRLLESTMRSLVKSDNRKPWNNLFYSTDFTSPLAEKDAGKFALPLEMVRLGPSASNKQPWRIVLSEDKNSCSFYLAHTPKYSDKMQRIDMGIAMCHFELTCRELGIVGAWVIKDPGMALIENGTEYIASWNTNI